MAPEGDSVQARITAFWSRTARDYETHPGNVAVPGTPEYDAWIAALRSALPARASDVLDVGAGTGFVSLIAAALGHRVTGIDLAEPMLEVARAESARRGLDVRFILGDAVAPPFRAESFDAVMNRHVLWTLREPERAFASWRTLLHRGGTVVAIDALDAISDDDPDATNSKNEKPGEGLFERYYNRETRAALPVMHLKEWAQVVEMFEDAGFGDVRVHEIQGVQPATADAQRAHVVTGFRGRS
jgi:SAM-dependent methyltransferase